MAKVKSVKKKVLLGIAYMVQDVFATVMRRLWTCSIKKYRTVNKYGNQHDLNI